MDKLFEIKQDDAQTLLNYITSHSVPKISFSEVMKLVQILQTLDPLEKPPE